MALGALVIFAMGLVPPMQMTVHDPYGKKGDRLFGDTTKASTYTTTHLVYRPVWWEAPDEVAAGLKVENVRVAWTWLVLQIAGVGLVIGGLAALRRYRGTDGSVFRKSPPSTSSTGEGAG